MAQSPSYLGKLNSLLIRGSGLRPFIRVEDPRCKTAILAIAVAILVLGLVLSIRDQPDAFSRLDFRLVLTVVLLGVPIAVCFNTIEFVLTGRLIGQTVNFARALEITIIGSAANMLPLPGSTMVRVASLKVGGAGFRDATAAVLCVSAIWVAVALMYAGTAILLVAGHLLGMVFLVTGLAILLVLTFAALRVAADLRFGFAMLAVKLILVMTDAARLLLCLGAIGTAVTFAQASALTVSGVAGTAVSIVPAGLGIRETVAAGLSPIVGVAAAAGFLAAALNRILSLATVAPIAILLVTLRARRSGT